VGPPAEALVESVVSARKLATERLNERDDVENAENERMKTPK
jgi:hypothetical protein